MSTHEVWVIRIGSVEKHPNADRLDIVKVYDYTCITMKGQFKVGDLAVFIEPDYIVPDRPEYAFLEGKNRIKTKRLRGVWSQGLLMPVSILPPDYLEIHEGDDVMEALGIQRYEPPVKHEAGPKLTGKGASYVPKNLPSDLVRAGYSLENYRRYSDFLPPGSQVCITEKIHGCNARYAYRNGELFVGSHHTWRMKKELTWKQKLSNAFSWLGFMKHEEPEQCIWWRVLETHPWIREFAKENPTCIIYGEIFGDVQDLKYGAANRELFFRIFDVYDCATSSYWRPGRLLGNIPSKWLVPFRYFGVLPSKEELHEMSMENTDFAGPYGFGLTQMGEGIVITLDSDARVALKYVSDRYLERA